jgi:hypothetical protein
MSWTVGFVNATAAIDLALARLKEMKP